MKPHRMKVQLNDDEIADDIYFEVWVLDTITGEVFMCDPQIHNKGKMGVIIYNAVLKVLKSYHHYK